MPRKDQDSLGQDFTRTGDEESPKLSDTEQSLGEQPTSGGNSSMANPGGGGLDMEVVDLARYTIEGVIGKGGMGEVQLATDTRLGRKVAIKRMLGEVANNRTAVSRFIAEAKAIAKLDHDNIVDIYDYGRATDGPVLIMQYIDGGSLLDCCREGALPLEEAVELTCLLCGALEMAHAAGIIHRDIKPANVLMTKDGSPRLTDFGLVRDTLADHGQTMAGAVLGTLDFMPPEQRRDAALVDARSDLWALAATLYQMVTGKSPKIIRFNNVPQALQDVLGKALEDEKDDRYQTAAEFRDALRGCLTAPVSAPKVAVDLSAGECPKCHAKNEADRKFCRGCGESLRVSCLSCSVDIPVWENFCADCGGNQKELVAARRAELDTQREKAESLRSEYGFDDSLATAREIAAVEDSRLQHLKEWSEGFIDETETEKERQEQNAANHYAEAQTHRAAFDYKSAIQAMESIPEAMRTSEMSSYLQQLQSDHAESEDLKWTNSERGKRRDIDGLYEVAAAEKKEGRRERRRQRREKRNKPVSDPDEKLQERRQKRAEQTVASLLENGNFVRAIKTLLDVPDKLRDMEWSELAHKAKDGFASQLVEMWKNNEALFLEQVDWFLERFPEDSRALNLKAKALYSYERYEEAGKCFETLMKLEPDKHVHFMKTAICANRCGDVTKAIKLLEQALQLKKGPGFNLIFYNLGCYYALQDRKKESIAMLSKAYEAGYRKASSYLEDPDLENVRYERDFVKLIKKGLEISFHCPGCKKQLTAPSSFAGKIAMCTKCGVNMNVPKMKQEHFLKRIWRLGW